MSPYDLYAVMTVVMLLALGRSLLRYRRAMIRGEGERLRPLRWQGVGYGLGLLALMIAAVDEWLKSRTLLWVILIVCLAAVSVLRRGLDLERRVSRT